MMTKTLILGAMLAGTALPAAAQQYYIVQDATTKKCTVVSQRPTTTTTTIVGDGVTYTTQEEATSALSKVKVCTK